MTEYEIRKIVAETVEQTLTRLGVDASDPIEVQKDMAHMRRWRLTVESIPGHGILTAIGIITAGILGLIWLAIKGQ